MGNNKAREDQIAVVRSVVGEELREMDIIRALHLANNDAAAAINIILDDDAPRKYPKISSSVSPPPNNNNPSITPNPTATKSIFRRRSSTEPPPPPPPSSSSSVSLPEEESDWWLVGSTELAGLSTCKGRRLNPGDEVSFSFPPLPSHQQQLPTSPSSTKFPSKRRFSSAAASSSEIVRFSTQDNGEVGRIPNEWARCLLPLVKENKIRIDGFCCLG